MQYFLLTVNDSSWNEHIQTGIAAINDPSHIAGNSQGNAQKQKALSEFALMLPGDLIFFYYQQSKEIRGIYEITGLPFYDQNPLVENGFINHRFAIRVAFQYHRQFPVALAMEELWMVKDQGVFWSLQQQRGDSAGRHAAIALTRSDGELLMRMLSEKNILKGTEAPILQADHAKTVLPYDRREQNGCLHYEATLQALLLEDLKYGFHKEILGDYEDINPFFPTSSQKEIDLLLIKYNDDKSPLWYQIIELKQRAFTQDELKVVMKYDAWVGGTLCKGNFRNVHTVGIAYTFTEEVIAFVEDRYRFTGRKIRLIEYRYKHGDPASASPNLELQQVN